MPRNPNSCRLSGGASNRHIRLTPLPLRNASWETVTGIIGYTADKFGQIVETEMRTWYHW